LVETEGIAGVSREALDAKLLAFADPVLLTARFDDRVHGGLCLGKKGREG
jgi:hypothetical protein